VGIDFNLFTSQLVACQVFLCFICFLRSLVLDISVSLALSIKVGLQFARYDLSVLLEEVEQLLLSSILVNVFH